MNNQTGDRVAIKIIDLTKQAKKEMILMELKVTREISVQIIADMVTEWRISIRTIDTRNGHRRSKYLNVIPINKGHERAPPPQSSQLHRELPGGGKSVGGDGVFGRGPTHRRRHGDHHERGTNRGCLQRGKYEIRDIKTFGKSRGS